MTLAPFDWLSGVQDELKDSLLLSSNNSIEHSTAIDCLELMFYYQKNMPSFKARLLFTNYDLVYTVDINNQVIELKKLPTLFHASIKNLTFSAASLDPGKICIFLKDETGKDTINIVVLNAETAILKQI